MGNVKYIIVIVISTLFISGCARDLSSNVYTSDSTLSLTLEGKIVSVRPIIIKENDKLAGNSAGLMSGAAAGMAAGASLGQGNGRALTMVGGAIIGGIAGAAAEGALSKQNGLEYIVKVDNSNLKADYYEGTGAMRNAISAATTNGLVTIVQGQGAPLAKGQEVYVIFSDRRVRVIAAE